ncbi:MAG: hypothetical protein IPG92_18440 [Flavobacteriales bacterium]|nr:hypothetical protein [Flavobacteriales bacterium]
MSLSTTGTKTLNSTLTNNGTINWSGGVINGGGTIQNSTSAMLNISFPQDNYLRSR